MLRSTNIKHCHLIPEILNKPVLAGSAFGQSLGSDKVCVTANFFSILIYSNCINHLLKKVVRVPLVKYQIFCVMKNNTICAILKYAKLKNRNLFLSALLYRTLLIGDYGFLIS